MEAITQQLQTLLQQNEDLNRRLQAAERATSLQAQAVPAGSASAGIDTRIAKQPGVFDGARAEWSDWSFTFRAYAAAVSPSMTRLMTLAESNGARTSGAS